MRRIGNIIKEVTVKMMQQAIKVTDSIYWIGGNDRETDLFEGLW